MVNKIFRIILVDPSFRKTARFGSSFLRLFPLFNTFKKMPNKWYLKIYMTFTFEIDTPQ